MGYLYDNAYIGNSPRGPSGANWYLQVWQANHDFTSPGGRVYKPVQQSGGTGHPSTVKVWNYGTDTVLETVDVSGLSWPADGAAGWVEFQWATARSFVAGTKYVIGYLTPSNYGYAYSSGAPAMPASGDTYYAQSVGKTGASDYTAIGAAPIGAISTWPTYYDTFRIGCDVYAGDVQPGPDTSIATELPAWLSGDSGENAHHTALPWTTKAAVDTVQTDVTTVVGEVDGLHAKISADGVTWDAKIGPLQVYGGVTSLGVSAGVEIVRTDLAGKASQSSVTGIATETSAIAASVALALALRRNALVDFPASPWVMTDETAFDTNLAYAEEADLYVVTFSDLGSNIVNTVAAGVDVSYRLAWWSPLIGAFAQQRRFIDTPSAHLWLDGTRLPGVLLHSPAGAAGTIQAWTYA